VAWSLGQEYLRSARAMAMAMSSFFAFFSLQSGFLDHA
jgi:hypothetical protein